MSILNSTLLHLRETRKWLKPITHTASLSLSVGRPWEIFRISLPLSGRISDLYTKEGDGTGYSSYLILSPDHGVGFSILTAGIASPAIANTVLADTLISTVLPALEAQAAAEAEMNFAGTYVESSARLNSSVSLAVFPEKGSGLMVTQWISNGSDMLAALDTVAGNELSLFQSDLRTKPVGHAGRVAFRGTYGTKTYKRMVGPFTDQITTDAAWEDVDCLSYGGISFDLFVFDVDAKGDALAVSPAVTGAKLNRVRA